MQESLYIMDCALRRLALPEKRPALPRWYLISLLVFRIDQPIWVVLPTHWLGSVGVKKSRSSGFEVLHGRKIQVYEREIGVRDFASGQRLQPLECCGEGGRTDSKTWV